MTDELTGTDNPILKVTYPTTLGQENELMISAALQIVTVLLSKLSRRILKGTNK